MVVPVAPEPPRPTAAPLTAAPLSRTHRPLGRASAALPLLLALGACTEIQRFVVRPEPGATPAAQPSPPAEPRPATVAVAAPEPEPAPIPAPQEKPRPGKLYEWDAKGRKLTRIVIDTGEQKARFYIDDEQVGWTTVASGLKTHPTPIGHFEILEKTANKRSNLYGKVLGSGGRVLQGNAKAGTGKFPAGSRFEGARMPYYLRLTYDGVGLHAGPIPRPGHPASHGCIRLPAKLAPVLFEHVDPGTQVSIVGDGPDYGNYAAKQRAYAAEQRAKAEERRALEERRAAAERRAAEERARATAATAGSADSTVGPASRPEPTAAALAPAPAPAEVTPPPPTAVPPAAPQTQGAARDADTGGPPAAPPPTAAPAAQAPTPTPTPATPTSEPPRSASAAAPIAQTASDAPRSAGG